LTKIYHPPVEEIPLARPLVFANGRILICQDEKGTIRDVYFPSVGLENHGHSIRAGICDLDGSRRCSWFEGWSPVQRYKSSFRAEFLRGSQTLAGDPKADELGVVHDLISNVGETAFRNPAMEMEVVVLDAVHPSANVFFRTFEVKNVSDAKRNLRLFSNQNYRILESKIGETAVVDRDVLIHYKRDRYILHGSDPKFDQYATGTAEWRGMEGTWKEIMKNGQLSGNPVAHGSVDSTLGWTISGLDPGELGRVCMWIIPAKSYKRVMSLHQRIRGGEMASLYKTSFCFWNSFLERISILPEAALMSRLPEKVRQIFYRSLLATVAHMDVNGSVIASCDSEIKQFGADLYTYCWPRDAAWACIALDRARYHHLSCEVFDFFAKTITDRGYFLHKYTPAGDFGSTWHPVPMIQIDETGLPLYALYFNWLVSRNVWTAGRYFGSIASPAAKWLLQSLDGSGLPPPSFDLWEERKGVFTYSASTVYAGLRGAAELALALGNDDLSAAWSQGADRIRGGILRSLYDDHLGRFRRSVDDPALDSSLFGVWWFGVLPPDDPRVTRTMTAVERELSRPSGGVARYEGDEYGGRMNSWIICTLWLASWHAAAGSFERALELISWCSDHAHPTTGLLPEQVADDGSPRSVLPLMWSHAAFVLAVLEYLEALGKREGKVMGGEGLGRWVR
jgi:GH15 family glucan-1,4-alpha-glucosidase